jgi:hypothetical protein
MVGDFPIIFISIVSQQAFWSQLAEQHQLPRTVV